MKPTHTLTLSSLCIVLMSSMIQAETSRSAALKNNPVQSEEFMDWGVGMFVHWSHDSVLGSVISHSMVGASDDYLDRYINDLPQFFNPQEYKPEEWAKLAKLAGLNYMVLTTKHHNGFCMWPTQTTDFSIANTPYKKDIVKQFVDACRKYDLKVGFYFSPEDFHFLYKQGHVIRRWGEYTQSADNPALLAYNKKQLQELLTNYGPIDMVFLDALANVHLDKDEPIAPYIHKLAPNCLVTRGEMVTPEQKIPDEPMPGPWEANFTMGSQWQFKPTNESYKSGGTLIEMLIDIRAKGGNLLINMGPEPSGKIPFEQERRFREMALWMFINQESIHKVRPCPIIKEDGLWYTRSAADKSTVYVFIPQGKNPMKRGERHEFTLKSIAGNTNSKITVLGQNDKVVEYLGTIDATSKMEQTHEGLKISIVRAQRIYNNGRWPNPIVVKLEGVKFIPAP